MSFIGIPIGFYAYILPGNINLMVLELYGLKKYQFLLLTLALILIFETIYCFVSIMLLSTLKLNHEIYRAIEIISFLMLIIMGLWMLFESNINSEKAQRNRVYRGLLSIVFHPQQIPYWVVMGILVNKIIPISSSNIALSEFAFFNAIGTLLAMLFYMGFGLRILNFFKLNSGQLNKIIGVVYILLASHSLFFTK